MARKKPENKAAADQALAKAEQDFQGVAALADQTETSDTNTQDLLAETLNAMFAFGQQLRQNEKVMEAFFGHKCIKFNKTTRENPYNGLVKIAFANTKKPAMLSKYARALHFVHDSKLNEPVRDWVKTKGIEACYKMASGHFGGQRQKPGEYARDKKIELGQKALAQLSASNSFEVDDPVSSPFVRAVLRMSEDGKTAIVAEILETSESEWNSIFARHCSARIAQTAALQDRPLSSLFHAISAVAGFAPPKAPTASIILRNLDTSTVVDFGSTAASFRAARVVLREPLADLPGGQAYALPIAQALAFLADYPNAADWKIVFSDPDIAIRSDHLRREFLLAPSEPKMRIGNFSGVKTKHFTLPWRQLRSVADERLLVSAVEKTTGKRPPARLSLMIDHRQLSVANSRHETFTRAFLDLNHAKASFVPHRSLALTDIQALADLLEGYEQDFSGFFVEQTMPDAAMQIEHQRHDGVLLVSIPLVLNDRMNYCETCEAL